MKATIERNGFKITIEGDKELVKEILDKILATPEYIPYPIYPQPIYPPLTPYPTWG